MNKKYEEFAKYDYDEEGNPDGKFLGYGMAESELDDFAKEYKLADKEGNHTSKARKLFEKIFNCTIEYDGESGWDIFPNKKIKAVVGIEEKAIFSTELRIAEFRELWLSAQMDSYKTKKEALQNFKRLYKIERISFSEIEKWQDMRP